MSLKVEVDFNATAEFSGANKDVSALVDGAVGSAWSRGKDQIRQFAPAVAGQFGFVLFNLSRDYSPGNADSPIAGEVLPGRKARLETTESAGDGFSFEDGTDFAFEDTTTFSFEGMPGRIIWTGLVDDIQQQPQEKRVAFSCLGNLSKLRGKAISTALYENITTSEALGYLLDEAGWPADARNIQAGLTTMSWWWLDNQDAFDAAMMLMSTEGPWASLYEDAEGNIVFENRDARTTQTRSTVSQASFLDTEFSGDVGYNPNFKDTIEAAVIGTDKRAAQGQSVIWQLGSTLTLLPNELRRFQIRSSDPFKNVVFPSAAPGDTVQTLTGDAIFTSGTFKPKFRDEIAVAAIDWDSTAAEIQTSLESISTIGAGNISCNGGPISTMPVSCSFVGIFAGQSVEDLIEIVESTLNPVSAPAIIEVTEEHGGDGILSERQALRPSASLTGGSFTITVDIFPNSGGGTTASVAYNDTAGTIQTRLRALTGCGSFTTTGGPLSSGVPVVVNMIYSDNLEMMTIGGSGVTANVPTATINVAITIQGGKPDYILTAGEAGFELNRTSGAVVMLSVGAGVAGATLTGLQSRGQLVSVIRSDQVSFPEDITDIPSGKIAHPNVRAEIDLDFARTYVEMFVDHYSAPRPTVNLTIVTSLYSDENDSLFEREISDLIHVVEAQTGISADFHIEQIRQSVSGLTLITEFGCEIDPASLSGGGVPIFWY